MAKLVLDTAAASTPISLSEVETHLKWDDAAGNVDFDSDAYLTLLIARAVSIAEDLTWSRFYTQTWSEYLDGGFPDIIRLRVQPVQSITSISYTDTGGSTQTLANTVYELRQENGAGIVHLKYGQTWPATRDDDNVVRVVSVVGYGIDTACPVEIKHALLMIVASLAAQRGDTPGNSIIPRAAAELLSQRTFRGWA